MGTRNEMVSLDSLVQLIARLPESLQDEWMYEAQKIRRDQGRLPTLEDIVVFIEERAEEFYDPVYGIHTYKRFQKETPIVKVTLKPHDLSKGECLASKDSTKADHGHSSRASNFSMILTKVRCYMCRDNHKTKECRQMKKMSYYKRISMVRSKRLCFNCLEHGHIAKECESSRRCEMKDCRKKHHTLLHKDKRMKH